MKGEAGVYPSSCSICIGGFTSQGSRLQLPTDKLLSAHWLVLESVNKPTRPGTLDMVQVLTCSTSSSKANRINNDLTRVEQDGRKMKSTGS